MPVEHNHPRNSSHNGNYDDDDEGEFGREHREVGQDNYDDDDDDDEDDDDDDHYMESSDFTGLDDYMDDYVEDFIDHDERRVFDMFGNPNEFDRDGGDDDDDDNEEDGNIALGHGEGGEGESRGNLSHETRVQTFEIPAEGDPNDMRSLFLRMMTESIGRASNARRTAGGAVGEAGVTPNTPDDVGGDRMSERINDVLAQLMGPMSQTDGRIRRGNIGGIIGGERNHPTSQEYQQILSNIEKAISDPYLALESLRKISTDLLMTNQFLARRLIPLRSLTKSIVDIMENSSLKDHAELQLAATNCLENVFEVDEVFICHAVAQFNLLSILKESLEDMSYIDLAEEKLNLLNKISKTCCRSVLLSGIIENVYNFIDFFPSHTQYKLLDTVANSLSRVHASDIPIVAHLSSLVSNITLPNLKDKTSLKHSILIYYNICANYPRYTFHKLIPDEVPTELIKSLNTIHHELGFDNLVLVWELLLALIHSDEFFLKSIVEDRKNVALLCKNVINGFKNKEESLLVDVLPSIPVQNLKSMLKVMIAIVYNSFEVDTIFQNQEHLIDYPSKIDKKTASQDFCTNDISGFISDVLPLVVEILSHTQNGLLILYCLNFISLCSSLMKNNSFQLDDKLTDRLFLVLILKMSELWDSFEKNMGNHKFTIDYSILSIVQIFSNLTGDTNLARKKYVLLFKRIGILNSISELRQFLDSHRAESSSSGMYNLEEEYQECVEDDRFEELEFDNWVAITKYVHPEMFSTEQMEQDQIRNYHGSASDFYSDITSFSYEDPEDYFENIAEGAESLEYNSPDLANPIFKSTSIKKTTDNIYLGLKNLEQMYDTLEFNSAEYEFQSKLHHYAETLKNCDTFSTSTEYWSELWSGFKSSLYNSRLELVSYFELIDTGLLRTIAHICKSAPSECVQTFINVFTPDGMSDFVGLLQNCIDRFQHFDQPGFLHSAEPKRDMKSFSKPLNIFLDYCGENESDESSDQMASLKSIRVQSLVQIDDIENAIKKLWVSNINRNKELQPARKKSLIEESENWDFKLYDSAMVPMDYHLPAIGRLLDTFAKNRTENDTFSWAAITSNVRWKYKKISKLPQNSGTNPYCCGVSSSSEPTGGVADLHRLRSQKKGRWSRYVGGFDSAFDVSQDVKDALELILVFSSTPSLNNCESTCYVNEQLTNKLHLQLKQPLITLTGLISDWIFYLAYHYPVVFTYEAREKLIINTCRGTGRSYSSWMTALFNGEDSEDFLRSYGEMYDYKLHVSRQNIFDESVENLEIISDPKKNLIISFTGENGTGTGPTLEYYSIMSKKFTRKSLNMWRDSTSLYASDEHREDNGNTTESGKISGHYEVENEFNVLQELFPQPLLLEESEMKDKICENFKHLGIFLARSLMDLKMVDFRFNEVFFQILDEYAKDGYYSDDMNARNTIKYVEKLSIREGIELIMKIDRDVGNSFKYIYEQGMKNISLSQREEEEEEEDLINLNIPYSVPGFNNDPSCSKLFPNDISFISNENFQQYLENCIEVILGKGILPCLRSFLDGFNTVFPYKGLLFLTPLETSLCFGKFEEDWSFETISSCLKADYGYTTDSVEVHNLITIMSEFTLDERRLFLQFVTSSPRLPVGGFPKLIPKLSITVKPAEENSSPDSTLPSVMTCVNYLKLPKYSNIETMRRRVIQAITEGGGEFSFT